MDNNDCTIDLKYSKISLNNGTLNCLLQVEWGPENALKIMIVSPESAWSGKLSAAEIKEFVNNHDLELHLYVKEMKSALCSSPENEGFVFSLDRNVFAWKRKLSSGLIMKLGQISVSNVPIPVTYDTVLGKALDQLFSMQQEVKRLQEENSKLKTDRDNAVSKVTECAALKEEWEKTLYGRFVAVLNAKKERILLLEEALDMRAVECAEESKNGSKEGANAPTSSRAGQEDDIDEDDPYAGSTDVDTDAEDDGAVQKVEEATAPASLRRCRDIFNSFDSSPGSPSPAPVLPKRARLTDKSRARNVLKEATKDEKESAVCNDEDDDMEPLTFNENSTQDLVNDM